jgi:4-amino-4-deoxy-L-arabinose transferase-like glycosyltransferase
MSAPTFANNPDRAVPPGKALGILAAATIACLVPFVDKAFCIDNPLFLWAAAQIQAHPLDFYGCEVNWYGTMQPLYEVMKNPPLACYYRAAAAALVGRSEPALHAAFLLPAIGAIWGTWLLARSLCGQPVSAALAALVTPASLVSSTNLMCDTTMLCLWTWAIALWIRGLNSANGGWLAAASVLIAAAGLTKYFAISLIPLLAVYTIL